MKSMFNCYIVFSVRINRVFKDFWKHFSSFLTTVNGDFDVKTLLFGLYPLMNTLHTDESRYFVICRIRRPTFNLIYSRSFRAKCDVHFICLIYRVYTDVVGGINDGISGGNFLLPLS